MEKKNFIGVETGDHVAVKLTDGQVLRGEVMHVSRKQDLIVVRDQLHIDIDHQIHVDDVVGVRDAPRPNGRPAHKVETEEA